MKRTICTLLLATLCLFASAADDLRLNTVVIDPGHGGKDPGAVSADGKNYEKTFVLDISKRLSSKISEAYPDVNVILTRSKDEFVELADRAGKANRADADLFISIHVNSTKSSKPNGYSLHILGQSSNKNRDLFAYNLDVCKQENSVVSLEEDSAQYEGFEDDPESQIFAMLMQSAYQEQSLKFAEIAAARLKDGPITANRGIWQNPFIVLWKTSMPAVLVELGFISNSSDLGALRRQNGRDDLAQCLFEAFKEYKTSYDGIDTSLEIKKKEIGTEPVPGTVAQQVDGEARYGVQIFAVSRLLPDGSPEFLGYEHMVIKSGNVNKYIIGLSDSPDGARKNLSAIKKKYPQAFLVKISSGRSEMLK